MTSAMAASILGIEFIGLWNLRKALGGKRGATPLKWPQNADFLGNGARARRRQPSARSGGVRPPFPERLADPALHAVATMRGHFRA